VSGPGKKAKMLSQSWRRIQSADSQRQKELVDEEMTFEAGTEGCGVFGRALEWVRVLAGSVQTRVVVVVGWGRRSKSGRAR
jgi:hypothetical protein